MRRRSNLNGMTAQLFSEGCRSSAVEREGRIVLYRAKSPEGLEIGYSLQGSPLEVGNGIEWNALVGEIFRLNDRRNFR